MFIIANFKVTLHMLQWMNAIKLTGLLVLILLQACTSQSRLLDIEAEKQGFSRLTVDGDGFQHVIFTKDGGKNNETLHVYLDGDGKPWIKHHLIAADPTPVNPLMFNLMALDKAPSIYLGRPCYHGFAKTPPCAAELWTSARYSLQVVSSMERVLRDYIAGGGYKEVVLIGHSGGGTLAMLLAERVRSIRAVVTIAGNLDIDAWTRYHGYSALDASLNPANRPALDADIHQYHLIGKDDKNIPYQIVETVIQNQTSARVLMWDGFDHACCWENIWQEFLNYLETDCS
jgi:pimeloyl-ACP methyl ester carboxylesterase